MPDIPVWPLISDQSSLRASESPEQKNCEQNQEDHNGNSNVQLCAADLFIRLNVFGARETGDEAFGKALHNGKSEHGGCALIHRFRQETRSEEHTSELQSRLHLVCRLLLEKKK